MFGFLFGWRNASKCKRLVKQVQCRLKLLKNKRYAVARNLRGDVAQLIRMGDRSRALTRAEQLFRDENLMAVYELLDHFSEFIILHMSYIRRHRELPNDINEAVSSLVFASSRCGDIPELCSIRQLFGQRYGQRFLSTALHLLPDNLVNSQIKERLSVAYVSDDVKSKLMDEIAREYCLSSEVLALEYTSDFHKQVKESNSAENDRKEIMSCSAGYSVPCQEQHAEVDGYNVAEVYRFTITDLDIEQGGEVRRRAKRESMREMKASKASRDETVYDIEELQAKDQRVFRFIERVREMEEQKSLDGLSGKNSNRKRSRRRTWENVMKNDMECVVYYSRHGRKGHQKPCKVYYTSSPNKGSGPNGERVKERFMVPKHVHPKLPDYDEIAAKFMALRRERLHHHK